jgi:hypothetical protein
MKTIPCSYKDCNQRRIHFTNQDENRPHQMIEVESDYEGDAYCSFTCAILDGKMSVKNEQPQNHKRAEYIIDSGGKCWLPPSSSRMEGWARYEWFRKKMKLEGHTASKETWELLKEQYQVKIAEESK